MVNIQSVVGSLTDKCTVDTFRGGLRASSRGPGSLGRLGVNLCSLKTRLKSHAPFTWGLASPAGLHHCAAARTAAKRTTCSHIVATRFSVRLTGSPGFASGVNQWSTSTRKNTGFWPAQVDANLEMLSTTCKALPGKEL